MSISITLHRVSIAESINDIKNLKDVLYKEETHTIRLYKTDHPFLAIAFVNKEDPYEEFTHLGLKAVYGNLTEYEDYTLCIGGFLASSEVKLVADWLLDLNMTTPADFESYYDQLSPGVKQQLSEWNDAPLEGVFENLIRPLISFYNEAKMANESIVLTGG